MQKRKRNKVRRIAPRPRNAPKPLDDGMQHFIVSVPRQADPIVDQAVREQVAGTIEGSVHAQRFTDIEEAANAVPTVTKLAPDPDDIAASMRRLHDKLGISSPDDAEPSSSAPDYGPWFQPVEQDSPPQSEESWLEAVVAVFVFFKRIAQGTAAMIWLIAACILGASALKASLRVWEWLN